MTEILYCMRILIICQTVQKVFWANAEAQHTVLQEKV